MYNFINAKLIQKPNPKFDQSNQTKKEKKIKKDSKLWFNTKTHNQLMRWNSNKTLVK